MRGGGRGLVGAELRRTLQPQLPSKGTSLQPGDPQASRGHFWASEPIPVASSHRPHRAGPPQYGGGDRKQGQMLPRSPISSGWSVPGQSRSAKRAAPGFLFMGSIHPQLGFSSALP